MYIYISGNYHKVTLIRQSYVVLSTDIIYSSRLMTSITVLTAILVIHMYYCMTGRAIWGILPPIARPEELQ